MNFKGFGNDPGGSDNGTGGRPPAPGNYISRQSSVYSLTFDEFMTTMGGSGKDFGSMNMDELLKSIWTAEEVQTTGSATAFQTGTDTLGGVGVAHLQKQGSLTLPRTLSQKTVDDVWKDISKDYGGSSGSAVPNLAQAEKQPTLGEMTLEEFLVRAGVVREDAQQFSAKQNDGVFGGLGMGMGYNQQLNKINGLTGNSTNRIGGGGGGGGVNNNDQKSMVVSLQSPSTNLPLSVNGVRSSNQQQQQMQQNSHSQQHQQQIFPMGFATQMPLGSPQGMRGGIVGLSADQGMNGGGNLVQGMVGLQPAPVHVPIGSPATSDKFGKSNGDTSSVSPVPYVFNGGLRGRKNGGAVEKVIERRQRRMIKNRESAARSRARKQAYTMELEAEIAKLKEENQELQQKQEEIMEIQKNQVMKMLDLQREVKRRCLRRTLTGPW